ncbi:MAG TPA: hypothetical protein VMS75_04675 [Terriglobales bacterium]|nr:hypothetical protein [Terriglobales bacterium]
MKKATVVLIVAGLALLRAPALLAQFTADELGQFPQWEEFLKTADIVNQSHMVGPESVTSPWRLTLRKGDVTHDALWKSAEGRMQGYVEGWQYEICAYRMSEWLGLHMVSPTIERRFQGDRGSLQYWITDCISLKEREEKKIKMPSYKVFGWNRDTYLQRFFDNLIANEDRHQNQILITKDWRMILIDHSRSFRSSGKFVKALIYTEKHPEGPKLMSELPRAIVDKVKTLTFEGIKGITGDYLTDDEIKAVLIRRDLILGEIDKLVKKNGQANVLY